MPTMHGVLLCVGWFLRALTEYITDSMEVSDIQRTWPEVSIISWPLIGAVQ